MPNVIEIADFAAPELDIYARLTEGQLKNRAEPSKGLFIAESPNVIHRALDAGYEPVSLLMERKHIAGKAAALLKRSGQPFVLLLAGEGPDRGNLERLAADLDIQDRTGFLGFIRNGEDLRSLYTLSDLFVFPSIYDNAPMVVREAASNGTPSLLIRGSCSAEGIEDGVNGFLCEDTPEDIARAIREALPRAAEAGQAARRTIPQPWDEIMTDVVAKYEALIEKKKAEHED